jgi:16S rRNA (cytidine1402-2'-O)-methyltransferase
MCEINRLKEMKMTEKPALILLPNLLGDQKHHQPYLPISVDKVVATLDGLIAESEPAGRRYLGRFETKKPLREMPIAVFDGKTPESHIDFLLEPLKKGERWGYVSDAGLPCLADPGALLVRRARSLGILVQAFVGPSSLFLALMLSGLPGQRFTFHGYLDKESEKSRKQIQKLEKASREEGMTQMFIETPYRNAQMLETLLSTLSPETWLCAAWELTLPDQGILSQPVSLWKKSPLPNLEKRNTVFLISAT